MSFFMDLSQLSPIGSIRKRLSCLLPSAICLIAIFGSTLVNAGCGRKGNPVPPEFANAAPVVTLLGRVAENGVVLDWNVPAKTYQGKELTALSGFMVKRRKAASANEAESDFDSFTIISEVPLRGATYKEQLAAAYSFTDSSSQKGVAYEYQVVAVSEDGDQSVPGNVVRVTR